MPPPSKRSITIIALVVLLTIFAFELRWLYARVGADNVLPDFIEYWAAGRAILSGQNPYSPQDLLSLQNSVGWTKTDPLMMYNPPWVFPFILPFCLSHYPLGKFLWFLCHMALVFLCADWAWRLHDGPEKYRYVSLFIAFTFAPALFAIGTGQIVPFILLGVVAFLQCEKLQKGWPAGLLLVPLAIKPHILYLFWIALLLWIYRQKKWPVVLAMGAGLLTAAAVPLILYPDVISRYFFFILHETPLFYISPAPGSFLRFLLGEEKLWMQALPPGLGLAWLLFYWKKNRKDWRWEQRMPAIIFASLLTAPYGWSFDYALLLPAVMKFAIEAFRSGRRKAVTSLIVVYLAINGAALSLRLMAIPDHYMFWFGPVLLAGYLLWTRITPVGQASTSSSLQSGSR